MLEIFEIDVEGGEKITCTPKFKTKTFSSVAT